MQLVEAFLFGVDQVNQDSTILPELKLGAVAFDTCGSVDRARREVLNFVSGTVEYRSGYPQVKASVSKKLNCVNETFYNFAQITFQKQL